MKASVIVDNIGTGSLKGEWGLCIYIEYNGQKILLDTGSSGLFLENAGKLGLSPEEIDYAVLSHAHYDHANGMAQFFRSNTKAKFYLRDACGENCYKNILVFKKYIGLPRGILTEYKDRIVYVSGNCTITEGVSLLPHKTPGMAEKGKKEGMYIKEKNGKWSPDDFSHEQSLIFDTPKGMVIFNSCSHGGADCVIREAADAFPGKKILALIGGFHLFNKSEEDVRNLARRIKETEVRYIYTGHCTGRKAYEILKDELGDTIQQLKTGLQIEF